MAAFGFKKQFVHPICLGLGIDVPHQGFEWIGDAPSLPKLQTIHMPGDLARPGDALRLFYADLTIGTAICRDVRPITLNFNRKARMLRIDLDGRVLSPDEVAQFARAEGFRNVSQMSHFWACEHVGGDRWHGFVTRWEPA